MIILVLVVVTNSVAAAAPHVSPAITTGVTADVRLATRHDGRVPSDFRRAVGGGHAAHKRHNARLAPDLRNDAS